MFNFQNLFHNFFQIVGIPLERGSLPRRPRGWRRRIVEKEKKNSVDELGKFPGKSTNQPTNPLQNGMFSLRTFDYF